MRVQQHVHKLKRHRYKSTGSKVYFCVLDCGFKIDAALALGKRCVCWRCGKDFSMNEYSMRLAKPHCNACTKSKETEIDPAEVTTAIAKEGVNSLRERMKNLTFAGKEDI